MVEPDGKGLEWRLPPRLYTFAGLITLISAYAPTLTLKPETRDEFYTNLNDVIKNIHISNHLLLGDFNARVFLLGFLWSWQEKREQAAPTRALILSWPLCDQFLFPDGSTTKSVMASRLIKALAPARHGHC